MESVELKEKSNKRRIKHSFPRRELYHRWIHSPEYCYTNKGQRYPISGFKNWLICGDFGKKFTESYKEGDIEDAWHGWRKESCIAVINRETKHIIVNMRFEKQSYELLRDIPDNYTIFKTEENIIRADILSTGGLEDALRLHSNYLIEQFAQHYNDLWLAACSIKRTCHINYDDVFIKPEPGTYALKDYADIVDFVKKYKIKQYDWYNKDNNCQIWIYNYKGFNKEFYKIKRPTLKQIITKKIFDKKTILHVKQIYFYTKYCYGKGISIKTVKENWNKLFDIKDFNVLCKKFNYTIDVTKFNHKIWQNTIEIINEVSENRRYKIIEHNKEQSNKNYQEAIERLKALHGSNYVNDWRENNKFNKTIEYDCYIPPYTSKGYGNWYKETLKGDFAFDNTQLKLNKDIITTSRSARVNLEDAIKMWKLYIITTKGRVGIEGHPIIIRMENTEYKVGIYNLRAIQYCQKKTDAGKLLDKWEWCIVIGCHYLWIDDFLNFVKYYNLYALFDIEPKENKNVKPFKIKINNENRIK